MERAGRELPRAAAEGSSTTARSRRCCQTGRSCSSTTSSSTSAYNGPDEIDATRSTDGGATFSGTVRRVALLATRRSRRSANTSLSSAEVDAAGRMYVAWEGCRRGRRCSASRIVPRRRRPTECTWTPTQAVTTATLDGRSLHARDRRRSVTPGRLALVFHAIPDNCADDSTCPGIDVFQTTSKERRPHMDEAAAAHRRADRPRLDRTNASIGLMLGDYVSTSYVRGRPVVRRRARGAARREKPFRDRVFAHPPAELTWRFASAFSPAAETARALTP